MADPIDPTPESGSVLEVSEFDESWTPQPSSGSVLEVSEFDESWTPQIQSGSILEVSGFTDNLLIKVSGVFVWSDASIKSGGMFHPATPEEIVT